MSLTRRSLVVASLALAACAGSQPSSNTINFQGQYTLQGVVADAVTGQRVGGSDLKLFLIQGVDVRTPSRLNSDATDPLVGEYAFANIPVEMWGANITYKLVAIKPGYQRFEADLTFAANWDVVGSTPLLDTVYNRIGNIYLFPIGASAPDFTFTVTYNGKPVPQATVQLDPVTSGNSTTFNQADAIGATSGLLASLSGTTDASGQAKFEGTALALGAAYQVQVLPTTFTDSAGTAVRLARFKGVANLVAGVSIADQRVALSDLTATTNTVYITGASNLPVGQVTASGNLVLTFNAPVTLVNPAGFAAALSGTATGVLGAQPVTASLSADGLTLTLSPNFSTPIGAGDRGTTIVYSDGTALVSPKDYPADAYGVFSQLRLADGALPSGVVTMRAP